MGLQEGDFEKFNEDINTADWNLLLSEPNNVNEACEIFTNTYLNMATNNIPTRVVTIRPNDKPWFNSDLRREMRKKDRWGRSAIKKNSLAIYEKYRKQRNHVNNLKKTTKQQYYIDLMVSLTITLPVITKISGSSQENLLNRPIIYLSPH